MKYFLPFLFLLTGCSFETSTGIAVHARSNDARISVLEAEIAALKSLVDKQTEICKKTESILLVIDNKIENNSSKMEKVLAKNYR